MTLSLKQCSFGPLCPESILYLSLSKKSKGKIHRIRGYQGPSANLGKEQIGELRSLLSSHCWHQKMLYRCVGLGLNWPKPISMSPPPGKYN